MDISKRRISERLIWRAARFTVVFAAFYVYVWRGLDPRLVHHAQCPIFQADAAFFAEHLSRPGGLVEYAAALLVQWYRRPWAGAAILTAVAAAAALAGGWFLSRAPGRARGWVPLLAAAPLAALHAHYAFPLYSSLAVTLALGGAAGYARLPARSFASRLAAAAVLLAASYWLAGAAALLLAVLCGLFELLAGRRPLLAGVWVLLGAGIPYAAAEALILLNVKRAYLVPLPFVYEGRWYLASTGLCALFPVAAAAQVARSWFSARAARRSAGPPPEPPVRPRLRAAGRWAVRTAGPLLLLGLAAWMASDAGARKRLRIRYLSQRRDWPGVLREARNMPPRWVTWRVLYHVDRALFHEGRLLDGMFAYPQERGALGLMHCWNPARGPGSGELCMELSDLLWDLGHVNQSEHLAHEALELVGDRPRILKRLALVYVVKGQPVAARTFLNALAKDPWFADEARSYLRRLQADPQLPQDPELQRVRGHLPATEPAGTSSQLPGSEELLRRLLRANPRNRMAFEYLMAQYLLTGQLEELARQTPRLREFGRRQIPRHWEEALVIYHQQTGRALRLGGLRIRPGVRERLDAFLHAGRSRRAEPEALRRQLRRDFGDTYFHYSAFGIKMGRRG